jgi:tetratricopeptide (TPR) repeat protein
LRSVKLKSTRFYHCNLAEINLAGASLSETQFAYCNLEDANLTNACLIRVQFNQVNMVGAALDNLAVLSTPFAKQYVVLNPESQPSNYTLLRTQTMIDELVNNLTLKQQQQAIARFVIVGPTQVGKKRVVDDFIQQQADNYQLIHRLDASSPASLRASILQLTNKLDINFAARQGVWQKEWCDKIAAHKTWLLVFTDVVDKTAIEKLLPMQANGCVIITSRQKLDISQAVYKNLEDFTKDEAQEFLEHQLHDKEFSNTLLAISYYQDTVQNAKRYPPALLDMFCATLNGAANDAAAHFIAMCNNKLINKQPKQAKDLLAIFYEVQLNALEDDTNAYRFLIHLLYLAKESVPYKLQRKLALKLGIDLDTAIIALQKLNLLHINEKNHIVLAPYLAECSAGIASAEQETVLNNLCQAIIQAARLRNFAMGANELNEILLSHAEKVLENMKPVTLTENISHWNYVRLVNFIAQHYTQVGNPTLAKQYFEDAYSYLNAIAIRNDWDITKVNKALYDNLNGLHEYLPHALAYNLFWQGRMQFYRIKDVNKEACHGYLEQAAKLAEIIEQEDSAQRKFVVRINIDCKGLLYMLANSPSVEDKNKAIEAYKKWASEDNWIDPVTKKRYVFINEHGSETKFDDVFHVLGCYSQIMDLFTQLQNYPEAKTYCDKLFTELSKQSEAYRRAASFINKQGKLNFGLGEYEQSQRDFIRALGYYPSLYPEYTQVDAYLGLAQACAALENYDRATTAIEQCIAFIQELGLDQNKLEEATRVKEQIEAGWRLQKVVMLREPIRSTVNEQVKQEIGKNLKQIVTDMVEIKQQQKELQESMAELKKIHTEDMQNLRDDFQKLFSMFENYTIANQQAKEEQAEQSNSNRQPRLF